MTISVLSPGFESRPRLKSRRSGNFVLPLHARRRWPKLLSVDGLPWLPAARRGSSRRGGQLRRCDVSRPAAELAPTEAVTMFLRRSLERCSRAGPDSSGRSSIRRASRRPVPSCRPRVPAGERTWSSPCGPGRTPPARSRRVRDKPWTHTRKGWSSTSARAVGTTR